MRNLKLHILFVVLFLFIFGLQTEGYASKISDSQIAQILTNIQSSYTVDFLVETAIKVGKSGGIKSIDALGKILKRCDEIDFANSAQQSGNQTDIVRAYVMFYLAEQSKKMPIAKNFIEDNFALKRPICIALAKANYYDLYRLMNNEILNLFSKYPSTIQDNNLTEEISLRHSGIKFILKNKNGGQNKIVNEELLNAMLDFALSVETIRSSKYFNLCKKVLGHDGSYLWDKPVIRAVMKNKTSNYNKYELIKKRLKATRNTENDKCEWDFNKPETILFSIKNISSEAYLILSLWRLNIELNKKISETLPSLNSSSFTAGAAAVDCLASNEKTIPALKKVLESNDDNLKRFLARRLEGETNAPAIELLKEIKKN
jgi:hypothetical protein